MQHMCRHCWGLCGVVKGTTSARPLTPSTPFGPKGSIFLESSLSIICLRCRRVCSQPQALRLPRLLCIFCRSHFTVLKIRCKNTNELNAYHVERRLLCQGRFADIDVSFIRVKIIVLRESELWRGTMCTTAADKKRTDCELVPQPQLSFLPQTFQYLFPEETASFIKA